MNPRAGSPSRTRLWTIGHGRRSLDEFGLALQSADVKLVVDVRAFPRSRTNPQFNSDVLAQWLSQSGIAYEHWPSLGGRRRGLGDKSPNTAWENAAFRAYADYMMTADFWTALDDLLEKAKEQPTAIMCSETLWWRCHRRLIADAATARGAQVSHILSPNSIQPHQLSPPAHLVGDKVNYITKQAQLPFEGSAAQRSS